MSTSTFTPQPELQIAPRVFKLPLPGLYYIEHKLHADDRGFFAEIALLPDLDQVLNKPFVVKQINLAQSVTNVARGFHSENWNKLITITRGTAFCAFADIRPESKTFGQVATLTLGEDDHHLKGSVFISRGLANSYCVVKGPVNYLYCVDDLYRDRDTSGDRAVSLFDPDLNVDWPIPRTQMLLSDRDQQAVNLKDLRSEK